MWAIKFIGAIGKEDVYRTSAKIAGYFLFLLALSIA
jgi:hypothetical protein